MDYQLAVLRHAKSDWKTGTTDFDRPLNKRGNRDAPLIGHWLRQQHWVPDLILASPAQRVRETLGAIIAELDSTSDLNSVIDWQDNLYLASRAELMQSLRKVSAEKKRLLVVGHNPGLEELVLYLSSTRPLPTSKGKVFTTANLALLAFDRPWSEIRDHSGRLLSLIRPRDLHIT
jgi:phosphohistidine phosphatase